MYNEIDSLTWNLTLFLTSNLLFYSSRLMRVKVFTTSSHYPINRPRSRFDVLSHYPVRGGKRPSDHLHVGGRVGSAIPDRTLLFACAPKSVGLLRKPPLPPVSVIPLIHLYPGTGDGVALLPVYSSYPSGLVFAQLRRSSKSHRQRVALQHVCPTQLGGRGEHIRQLRRASIPSRQSSTDNHQLH